MTNLQKHQEEMLAYAKGKGKRKKKFPGKVKIGQRTYKVDTRKEDIRTCEYKGHRYQLLYIGPTKYGDKAFLRRFDGTLKFWVRSELVTEESYEEKAKKSKVGEKEYKEYYKP
jgi:hypothetical protein